MLKVESKSKIQLIFLIFIFNEMKNIIKFQNAGKFQEQLVHHNDNTRVYGANNSIPTTRYKPQEHGFGITSWLPGIGDAIDIGEVYQSAKNGNYSEAAIGTGLLLVPNAIEKPVKALRKAKKTNVERLVQQRNNRHTNNLIKLLGNKKDTNVGDKFTLDTKPFANYLQSIGIDISKFSNWDLRNLSFMRRESIKPQSGRYATITEVSTPKKDSFTTNLYDGENQIGTLSGSSRPNSDNDLHVDRLESLDFNQHGISRDSYDSSIEYAKQAGYDGLVSGENLLSPEATIKVHEHYPNKQLVNNNGHYNFNFGATIRDESKPSYETFNNPVYRLISPSKKPVPTKHADIFHPSLINTKNWTLKTPNWRNPNIFKVGIPTIIGTSVIKQENE